MNEDVLVDQRVIDGWIRRAKGKLEEQELFSRDVIPYGEKLLNCLLPPETALYIRTCTSRPHAVLEL